MAGDAGLILTCAGCCCGHPAHGGALSPQRTMKATLRRLYKASGLDGRVRLAFTDCLGPCSEANVILLYLHGQPLWSTRPLDETVTRRDARECRRCPGRPVPPVADALAWRWSRSGAPIPITPSVAVAHARGWFQPLWMWPGPAPGSAHTATQKGVWVQSWTYPRRPEDLKSGSAGRQ